MVKRRGVSFSPGSKKKRFGSSILTPVNQEKSILNDGLLNLYKKDLMEKYNVTEDQVDPSFEKQLKSENIENLKTPAREKKKRITGISTALVAKFSSTNYEDVGGMLETILNVEEMIAHYLSPQLKKKKLVRGILLHGPPGCGKTLIARAIAGEIELPILEVGATELVNGISGESEGQIRQAFEAAIATGHCILFLDNVHAICSKSSDNVMNNRMSQQLQKCFDELATKDKEGRVLVVGATNQLDTLDPALLVSGRFSGEVPINIPDKEARQEILEILCRDMKLSPELLQWLAKSTPGYVGGDLRNLLDLAERFRYRRLLKLIESSSDQGKSDNQSEHEKIASSKPSYLEILRKVRELRVKMINIPQEVEDNFHFSEEDFKNALKECVPGAKKEGFATVDRVTWDDVGALADVKKELQETIVWPIMYSDFYEENELSTPKGILLFGPKGCGKTLVAKAIANECNLNFLSVAGPELLNMYVGESERAIRKTFERAQNSAPCVIFFDEFDAICPPRSNTKDNAPVERVVNQLLCASDGTYGRKQVFLVAATNRLDKIDSAMLRPGRLETVFYIGLPSAQERADILRSLTKKTRPKIADDVPLDAIAHDPRCEEFSGADLAALVRKASQIAVTERMHQVNDEKVDLRHKEFILTFSHFDRALNVLKPSISEQDRKYFNKYSSLCHAGTNSAEHILALSKRKKKSGRKNKVL